MPTSNLVKVTFDTDYSVSAYPPTEHVNYFTITYHSNGGTGTIPSQSYREGTTVYLSANTFTPPSGQIFSYWNTEPDGMGTTYHTGDPIIITQNIDLYAIYESNSITITFYSNNLYNETNTVTIVKGSDYTIPDNSFTAESSYQFINWNTNRDGNGTTYTVGQTIYGLQEDLTLYAVWEMSTVILSYNSNYDDDSGSTTKYSYTPGTTVTVAYNSFSAPSGKSFAGWSMNRDGSGKIYNGGDTFVITQDTTLYAIWKDLLIVTLKANNVNSAGVTTVTEIASGMYYTFPECTFTPDSGYAFSHWNTKADGTGTSYNPNDRVLVEDNNLVLYAIWKAAYYFAIRYYANDGSDHEYLVSGWDCTQEYTVQENDFVHMDGVSTFSHWNTRADDSGTSYNPGDKINNIIHDIDLYAIWNKNTRTVTIAPMVNQTMTVEFSNGKTYTSKPDQEVVCEEPYGTTFTVSVEADPGYIAGAVKVTEDLD